MRRGLLCFLLGALGIGALAIACESSDPGLGTQGIHPQPQPNRRPVSFTAPCTATSCGDAPSSLATPRCKPLPNDCSWTDDTSVSYRPCDAGECGPAPGAEVCPANTTFKGNACGSENEGACLWSTACMPPRSTTPCPTTEGCGPQPAIGVICTDGGSGGLECMQLESGCSWQRTCD
ncbi:hypothetical protein AKJ09_06665 [Labilithrix luteola]|uniref:Lipoprotein n=1 Tax=Labilithrix luteola TaxID=1391654 RepID=A0A0K1Q2X6_9BACT|nr:hypothetical protein [Labilithrix luteola]AKV00002.1 hypothetical protein AKJ09_06665 [Labilithrix luteola]